MRDQKSVKDASNNLTTDYWQTMRSTLEAAIDRCNSVTSAIAAHEHAGKYAANDLLDTIDGDIRDIRKLLERIELLV